MIVLNNGTLEVQIDKIGAEIRKVTKDGKDRMWSGNPEHWAGVAPLLFPICSGLPNDKYTYNGETYEMPKHGFIRKLPFEVEATADDTATFMFSANDETLKITYKRNGKEDETKLKLIKDNGVYKTGLYVKDSIVGIGTLTFIDPETKRFGVLGHEILEQTTGKKFEIKDGKICESDITGIEKGTRGSGGEKNAIYNADQVYGAIDKNDETGVYGTYTDDYNKEDLIEISTEIEVGLAHMKTVIDGDKKEDFEITILNIDKDHETKNILFEVTDKTLLEKGNGIVQGMSGSPIIQNGKLVGAVTHVVVDDPHKGYGILITNMLEESEKKGD